MYVQEAIFDSVIPTTQSIDESRLQLLGPLTLTIVRNNMIKCFLIKLERNYQIRFVIKI